MRTTSPKGAATQCRIIFKLRERGACTSTELLACLRAESFNVSTVSGVRTYIDMLDKGGIITKSVTKTSSASVLTVRLVADAAHVDAYLGKLTAIQVSKKDQPVRPQKNARSPAARDPMDALLFGAGRAPSLITDDEVPACQA